MDAFSGSPKDPSLPPGPPPLGTHTGLTGTQGSEIWADAAQAEKLWDAVVPAGEGLGLEPAGMVALDRTRLEAGFPLIDVDFWNAEKDFVEGQKSAPYEIK